MHCLNCDAPCPAEDRFCGRCGQRTDTARLTLRDIRRELMHTFVDVERSVLAFSRALLLQPGVVAHEYVQGKRRRHYGPFATLATSVGLAAIAVQLSGFQMLAQDGFSSAPTQFFYRHFNWLLLVQLPLLGAAFGLVFRRAGLSWPEHMALAAYLLSVRALVLALVLPLSYAGIATTPPTASEVSAFWLVWYAYCAWGAAQFYGGRRWVSSALGAIASVIAHAAVSMLIVACWAAYSAILPLLHRT